MRKYVVIALMLSTLLFASIAMAANITLQWDASTSENVTGYRVYARTGASYDYTQPVWEGSTLTATVPATLQTAYVVRAYRVDAVTDTIAESVDSNEVVWTPIVPEAPNNLIIKAIDQIIQGLNTLKQAISQAG